MFDSDIIDMYEYDRKKAAEAVDKKYGKYCRDYAERFAEDESDVTESINNMHVVLRQCIPPVRPVNLKILLVKVLRNTAYNRYKRIRITKTAHMQIDEVVEELGDGFITSDEIDLDDVAIMKDAGRILNKCLKRMKPGNRDVFIRRFIYIESEEEIAKRYKTTPENVRIILENAKDVVRDALKRGGF